MVPLNRSNEPEQKPSPGAQLDAESIRPIHTTGFLILILDLGILEHDILLFGGPYSNLQATTSMREYAYRHGIEPEQVICSGDTVAYCGEPEQTVNLIRNWGIHTVMGNCEESVGNQQGDCGCGFEENTLCSTLSAEWYRFATSQVSAGNRQWMRSLPRVIRFYFGGLDFAVVHGGVSSISEFVFLSSDRDKKYRDAGLMNVDCVIGGHCGMPFGETIGDRHWLNTGVIGMPANDGTTDGWFLLLQKGNNGDTTYPVASWHRLDFDTEATAAAMRAAGLGPDYCQSLYSGVWPSMDVLPDAERKLCRRRLDPPPLALVPAKELGPSAAVA